MARPCRTVSRVLSGINSKLFTDDSPRQSDDLAEPGARTQQSYRMVSGEQRKTDEMSNKKKTRSLRSPTVRD
jgi:hypothetical protein